MLELHSLQLVESRSVSCSYRRPTWRGTSAAWGILPGRPNTCYTTSQGERYRWHHLCTEDVSGSQQHSEASRRRESPRCRAVHQYRTALWRFRSSRSSSECRRSRARIFRTASHSAPCFGGDWQDPCFYKYWCVSRDSHTRQQCPDFYQPKLNHWDSRRALVVRIHIPSTYHSIERPPRPCSLLSTGRPVVFVLPRPTLIVRGREQQWLANTSCDN